MLRLTNVFCHSPSTPSIIPLSDLRLRSYASEGHISVAYGRSEKEKDREASITMNSRFPYTRRWPYIASLALFFSSTKFRSPVAYPMSHGLCHFPRSGSTEPRLDPGFSAGWRLQTSDHTPSSRMVDPVLALLFGVSHGRASCPDGSAEGQQRSWHEMSSSCPHHFCRERHCRRSSRPTGIHTAGWPSFRGAFALEKSAAPVPKCPGAFGLGTR